VYHNLGAKVFMDAHEPVTLEEGDRYPLAPPDLGSLQNARHAEMQNVKQGALNQSVTEPIFFLMLGRSRPSSPIPRITDARTSGRCASQALPRVPMDDKLGSSCKQWEAQAAFFNVIAKHR
jgi:hypothetical protein